ncbi:MAG: hypothetical protein EOO65_02950 [Methanosarcinales archaeon]|nr:MAG: hypothetical protein EOO65_02950 [Methanosarcinales archaeon]
MCASEPTSVRRCVFYGCAGAATFLMEAAMFNREEGLTLDTRLHRMRQAIDAAERPRTQAGSEVVASEDVHLWKERETVLEQQIRLYDLLHTRLPAAETDRLGNEVLSARDLLENYAEKYKLHELSLLLLSTLHCSRALVCVCVCVCVCATCSFPASILSVCISSDQRNAQWYAFMLQACCGRSGPLHPTHGDHRLASSANHRFSADAQW